MIYVPDVTPEQVLFLTRCHKSVDNTQKDLTIEIFLKPEPCNPDSISETNFRQYNYKWLSRHDRMITQFWLRGKNYFRKLRNKFPSKTFLYMGGGGGGVVQQRPPTPTHTHMIFFRCIYYVVIYAAHLKKQSIICKISTLISWSHLWEWVMYLIKYMQLCELKSQCNLEVVRSCVKVVSLQVWMKVVIRKSSV